MTNDERSLMTEGFMAIAIGIGAIVGTLDESHRNKAREVIREMVVGRTVGSAPLPLVGQMLAAMAGVSTHPPDAPGSSGGPLQ